MAIHFFVKAWFYLKALFWLGSYGFKGKYLVSNTFQAVKNPSAQLTYLLIYVLGCLYFFGDIWGYLEIKSFSQRISENYGKKKFRRFGVILKL